MFDWLQNLRKSAAEKHQEAITAYLDGALSDRETAAFELRLRDDADLQSDVAAQRAVKAMLARTPRMRAPRSFVLDPAVYGRQKPAPVPLTTRLYPQLRAATLVASLLFAVVFTLNLWGAGGSPVAQDVAMAPAAPEIQMTMVVAESAVFDEAPLADSEESAESAVAQNAAAVEVPEPADSDDTVEMELAVQEEMAEEVAAVVPATLRAPPLTMEAGVTMSEAAPAGASADFEADDGSEDSGELIAPRATGTPDTNRASAADESEALATPSPLPTAPAAAADGAAEVADAAMVERDSQTVETTQYSNRQVTPLGVGGWLAIALGGLSLVLLGLTLWARRQARRL